MGWRDDDAMASMAMASLANGGGSNGGHHCQLSRGGGYFRHHPIIGINGSSKDAIPLLPSTAASIDDNCYCHC